MSSGDGSSGASTIAISTAVAVALIWVLYTRRTSSVLTQRTDPAAERFANICLGVCLGAVAGSLVVGEVALAGLLSVSVFAILAIGWAKNQDG